MDFFVDLILSCRREGEFSFDIPERVVVETANTMIAARRVRNSVAIATVVRAGYPDPTQFDRRSPGYDPKAKRDSPRWIAVDIRLEQEIDADQFFKIKNDYDFTVVAAGAKKPRSL